VQVLQLKASDPARVAWVRDVIDRQLSHLVRLVDDLLDVSRITQGKIRLQLGTIDLTAVIARAVESSQPVIEQLGHVLEVETPSEPVILNGDADRLTQVVTNLLNNAAKYTEDVGRIWLSLRVEGNDAVIRIRDTGIGIPPEMLHQVFELFAQANRSLDRAQGGLGIGLTLVRRLVQMHGGSVQGFSEGAGRGSEFTVRLPLLPAETPAEAPRVRDVEPLASARLRIVVVDDNVDGLQSLAQLFRLVGHEVAVAIDGPAAIEVVRQFSPDVVILDIGLPRMDGYEVARRLRADPETQSAVLIALSGYSREEDRQLAEDAGFDYHFAKPIEFSVIQKLLHTFGEKALA
jgi:CheY-like chemotaxis protein